MPMTIRRNAVSAAILSFAALAFAAPALGDGGGDPSPALIQSIDEGLRGKSDQAIQETLQGILEDRRARRGPPPPGETVFLRRVRAELKRREELKNHAASSATPDASSATSAASTPATTPPTSPVPPAQASAPPLAPPTASTPAPTASSGNCPQPGTACAEEEARQRQARKAETKRAQAAAVGKLTELGVIIPR